MCKFENGRMQGQRDERRKFIDHNIAPFTLAFTQKGVYKSFQPVYKEDFFDEG